MIYSKQIQLNVKKTKHHEVYYSTLLNHLYHSSILYSDMTGLDPCFDGTFDFSKVLSSSVLKLQILECYLHTVTTTVHTSLEHIMPVPSILQIAFIMCNFYHQSMNKS